MEKYQELKKGKKGKKKVAKPFIKPEEPKVEPIDETKTEGEIEVKEEVKIYTPETAPKYPPPGTIIIDNVIQL